jgi:hypothetical protein
VAPPQTAHPSAAGRGPRSRTASLSARGSNPTDPAMLMLRGATFVFIRAFEPSDPTRQLDSAGVSRMPRGQRVELVDWFVLHIRRRRSRLGGAAAAAAGDAGRDRRSGRDRASLVLAERHRRHRRRHAGVVSEANPRCLGRKHPCRCCGRGVYRVCNAIPFLLRNGCRVARRPPRSGSGVGIQFISEHEQTRLGLARGSTASAHALNCRYCASVSGRIASSFAGLSRLTI